MEPVKRKGGRPRRQEAAENTGPSLKLSVEADRLLSTQSKKLKLSKRQYASAAVVFFAENGLNPAVERPFGLAAVESKVGKESKNTQNHNAEIGNRVIAIMRGFERNSYDFHRQHEVSQAVYFEKMERNILQYLVNIENKMLKPMIEELFKCNIETFYTRGLCEQIFLQVLGEKQSDWGDRNDEATIDRNKRLVVQLKEFVGTNTIPIPTLTERPVITPVPAIIKAPISEILSAKVPTPK